MNRGNFLVMTYPLDLRIHTQMESRVIHQLFRYLLHVIKELFNRMGHIREGFGSVHLHVWTRVQMQRDECIASC